MITDFLIGAVIAVTTAVLSLMPTFDLPDAAAYDGWMGGVLRLEPLFPVTLLLALVLLVLAVEVALRLWDFGVWIWHQFWGSD